MANGESRGAAQGRVFAASPFRFTSTAASVPDRRRRFRRFGLRRSLLGNLRFGINARSLLFTVIFPRRETRVVRRDDGTTRILRLGQAAPVPQAPLPTPTPQPFPTGPAANDPIFRRGLERLIGRGIYGGLVGIVIGETIDAILEKLRKQDKERAEAEQRNREQIERRQAGRVEPLPEIIFPSSSPARRAAPVEIPAPRPVAPPAGRPAAVPEISPPRPAPAPVPAPFPAPVAVPGPVAPTSPRPGVSPALLPFLLPTFLPFATPSSSPLRVGSPATNPANLPQPIQAGLTGFNIGSVQLPTQQPAAQAESQKCEAVKRRRRRKGKCREGFFIERAGETQYTTWRTRDCATGEVVRDTKRKRDKLIRDSSNVADLFGGL